MHSHIAVYGQRAFSSSGSRAEPRLRAISQLDNLSETSRPRGRFINARFLTIIRTGVLAYRLTITRSLAKDLQ